jgi:hypothetical protein
MFAFAHDFVQRLIPALRLFGSGFQPLLDYPDCFRSLALFGVGGVGGHTPIVPQSCQPEKTGVMSRPWTGSRLLQRFGSPPSGSDRAFYSPAFDTIQMPPDVAFPAPEYWSAVVVHETNHGTGHPTRMNRDLTGKFGSDAYACEEACVEMATVFVCNTLNLPTDFENSARYIGGWLKKLREDKREILRASADAEKIAAYTLAWHPDYAAAHEPVRPDARQAEGPQLVA